MESTDAIETLVMAWKGYDDDATAVLTDANYTYTSDIKSYDGSTTLVAAARVVDIYDGIRRKYSELKDFVISAVKEVGAGGLLVTGHGLGGAVASLMAADLKVSFPSELSRVRCVTFGSPKVFNESSAKVVKELRIESIRVQLEGDPIPHFPLNALQHSASEFVYVTRLQYVWSDLKDEDIGQYFNTELDFSKTPLKTYVSYLVLSSRASIRSCSQRLSTHACFDSTDDSSSMQLRLEEIFKSFDGSDFDKTGATALHWMVYRRSTASLSAVLKRDPSIAKTVDFNGNSGTFYIIILVSKCIMYNLRLYV
jgi:hypothetical protein